MVTEFEQLALDPLVSPLGIVSGQLGDQIDDRVVDWWASGPVRIGARPRYQPAMPAQNRAVVTSRRSRTGRGKSPHNAASSARAQSS